MAPPPPPAGGGPGGIGMVGGPGRWPPRPIDLLMRRLVVHCDAPRALLRVTPAERSLNTVSPLLSRPVMMLYGSAEAPCMFKPSRTPLLSGVLKLMNSRCRTSCADGPQSASGLLLSAGNAVGESA